MNSLLEEKGYRIRVEASHIKNCLGPSDLSDLTVLAINCLGLG